MRKKLTKKTSIFLTVFMLFLLINPIKVQANEIKEINVKENTIEYLDDGSKVETLNYTNGDIQKIIIYPSNNQKDIVFYNSSNSTLSINGEIYDLHLKNINDASLPTFSERVMRSANWYWKGPIKWSRNIAAGTTIALAATLISIYTGIPASKASQTLLAFFGLGVSSIDSTLEVKCQQWYSSKPIKEGNMTIPQIKYKQTDSVHLARNGKMIGTPYTYYFFTQRPY